MCEREGLYNKFESNLGSSDEKVAELTILRCSVGVTRMDRIIKKSYSKDTRLDGWQESSLRAGFTLKPRK